MNNFDSVVTRYNCTTPVNEREHGITRDVRPIGSRNRKWERIVKFSDNCYGLSDGYGFYNDIIPSNIMKKAVPILWQRTRDGYEKVTVRAGFGGQNNARYQFLLYNLPNGIHFIMNMFGNGKHGVRINTNRYYDARTTFMTGAKEYHLPNQEFRPWMIGYGQGNPYQTTWVKNNPELYKKYTTDDRKLLVFKRKISETDWVLDSKEHLVERKGTKVKKAEKLPYRDAINNFYDYAYTIGCMLPQRPAYTRWNVSPEVQEATQQAWSAFNEYTKHHRQLIAEYSGVSVNTYYGGHNWSGLTTDIVRDILTNDEHELRVSLIVNVWHGCNWYDCDWTDADDRKRARARYTAHMNTLAGFVKAVTRKTEK